MHGRGLLRAMTLFLALAGIALILNACGEGEAGVSTETRARYILDGTPKLFRDQEKCPVCGGSPLHVDHHADVNGKRVYFDSEECVQKFKENQAEYVAKLKKLKREKAMEPQKAP